MRHTKLLNHPWSSFWITHPNNPSQEYGIYHFRKVFHLYHSPTKFTIRISADNRYRLFINGTAVNSGPVSGDVSNWYFDTIDIALYLKQGSNTVAVSVWNMGEFSAVHQLSAKTCFFLQGDNHTQKCINTNSTWKVIKNNAYTPCSLNNQARLNAYLAIGPGDHVNSKLYPWNWEKANYDDRSWENAVEICHPTPKKCKKINIWKLTERNIPLFKEKITRFPYVRRSSFEINNQSFLQGRQDLVIPSNQTVSVLLDENELTIAYPEIILSGGKDSMVKLIYAESLYEENGKKGNRNEIEGKNIYGNYDTFISDGGIKRCFRPLWIRTYRYLQLNITTTDEPLIVNDIYNLTTGYPLQLKAEFKSNDPSLQHIWNVGWRTAQLCAGEMYYDTPYYEQLQYVADTRIQALISLYTSGDNRLMRKAIVDFYHSIVDEGLTQSRYPSHKTQIIPAFSLFWVSMIHDYWMHCEGDQFVVQFLDSIDKIMLWFENKIDSQMKMLGPLTHWNFVDWNNFDERGTAPGSENGNSSIVSLHYSYTLKLAADLCNAFSKQAKAKHYFFISEEINQHTFSACFNLEKSLFADTPEQNSYSQHAGIWAVLSGSVPSYLVREVMKNILTDRTIGQATYFYQFYLFEALRKAEMTDLYLNLLTPWKDMLDLGLSTFAEKPEPSRSDCHAWSASPNYHFLSIICGIIPDLPGFKKVLIKPSPGSLTSIKGSMPHPLGIIKIKLIRNSDESGIVTILLPLQLTGMFIWKDKKTFLHGGKQTICL